MTSNLLLVLGPLAGLCAARLFGRWRPLSAFAAAVTGQLVVFYTYAFWQHYRVTHSTAGAVGGYSAVVRITPTLGGRLTAIAALLAIAAVVAALLLGAQALASRLSNGPPPAV